MEVEVEQTLHLLIVILFQHLHRIRGKRMCNLIGRLQIMHHNVVSNVVSLDIGWLIVGNVSAICKGLFIGSKELVDDNVVDTAQQPTYDVGEECEKEIVQGEESPLLVVIRACFAPSKCKEDD